MSDTPTHIRDYQLLDLIAAGAHSVVHRALDRRTGAIVAIKQVTTRGAQRHDSGEAALLRRVHHPVLPDLYAVWEVDDAIWLVMEYIPGDDLSMQLARNASPFPLPTVQAWADQLLDALSLLHAQSPPIVHCDIKPGNLKVDARGQVRLLDFGVARHVADNAAGYTPAYAAPEQMTGAAIDPRTDLYALTATLYDLCTGVKPPAARLRLAALAAGRADPLLPASAWNPALPHTVDACLQRGLALEPAQRFAHAAAMRESLRACMNGTTSWLPPVMTAKLVGRDALVGELRRAMLQPDVQLLTLVGAGGVGKTALARAVASELYPRHVREVRFLALEELQQETAPIAEAPLTLQHSFAQLADSLRQELSAQEQPTQHPAHALVLVLDGAEFLHRDDCARLGSLLTQLPQLKVLATSRRPLRIQGERIIAAPPLPTPDRHAALDATTVRQSPSVQLFLARAEALGVDLSMTDENCQQIAELCAALDGLPLALEEAARALGAMEITAIAEHLLAQLGAALTAPPASEAARRHSLAASIAWSVRRLTSPAQRLLARLSVFHNAFLPHTAHAICCVAAPDGVHLSEHETVALLQELVDASLLFTRSAHATTRYAMLATTRVCVAGSLSLAETRELRRRHASYFVELIDRGNTLLTPDAARREQLSAEYDNLIAALAWSIEERGATTALRLATALWRYWEIQGAYREGLHWLEQALALSATDDELRARALSCAGALARNQSQYAAAERCFTTALSIYQQLDDAHGVARMLNTLGSVAYFQDATAATAYFERALALHSSLGETREMAGTLNNLALLAEGQADYPRAAALHQQALELFQTLEDDVNTAYVLGNLGVVAEHSGELAMTIEYYQQSLELHERTGEKWGMAAMLTNLGSALGRLQRSQEALPLLIEGLSIFREVDDRAGMAQALSALAHNAQQRQAYQDATRFLATAERVETAIGYVAPTSDQQERQELKATLHAALGATAFDALWTAIDALPQEALLAELPIVTEGAETP